MTPCVRLIVPSIRTSIGKSEDPLERDGDLDMHGGVYGWIWRWLRGLFCGTAGHFTSPTQGI